MKKLKLPKKREQESGQALVEFALILPLFLLIVLFIIDFGWIAVQRGMVEQGCNHISWNITADSLGDTDSLDSAPSEKTYGTDIVAPLVYSDLSDSSLLGFDPLRLKVVSAEATLHNEESFFDVPGRNPADAVSAISRTRYMDLKADVTYDIYPITFVGKMVFGDTVTIKETLDCTRVIGTQHKSE